MGNCGWNTFARNVAAASVASLICLFPVSAQTTKSFGTKNHLSLAVPDIQKAVVELESRPEYKEYGRPLKIQVGKNGKRQVNLYDPDGIRVELMEPKTVTGQPVPPSTEPLPPSVY